MVNSVITEHQDPLGRHRGATAGCARSRRCKVWIILPFPDRLTIFTGENGSGKSTLLEAMAIAAGFNPEGGTRNYHFATRDSHSSLHQALTLVRRPPMLRGGYFLRAESFYQTATMEEAYADAQHPSKKYHERSHGESFLALADDQFRPPRLILPG